jgi:hypothetical protein
MPAASLPARRLRWDINAELDESFREFVFLRRERRASEGVRIGEGSHSKGATMRHLVLVSISSFCFALVASVGLAAYTAAHPEAAGVATVSGPEGRAPYHKIVG